MKKYVAEFIGTFALVLLGCGSAVGLTKLFTGTQMEGMVFLFNVLAVSMAFGMTIVAMAYSIGNVSGCHVNPAVSFAMLICNKLSIKDFIGYVIAQVAGAIAGAGVLVYLFGGKDPLGTNGFGTASAMSLDMGQAIVAEILLTFVFVITILGVTSKKKFESVAGLVIGFALVLVHILGIPLTGTSVNPARSFGPALIQGGLALEQVWVFILSPLVGAALAALVYGFIDTEKKDAKVEIDIEIMEEA